MARSMAWAGARCGECLVAVGQGGPGGALGVGHGRDPDAQLVAQQAGLGVRQDGGQGAVQGVQRVEGGAAEEAGVLVAVGGTDVEGRQRGAAQADGDRGQVGADHGAVVDDRGVGAAGVGGRPGGDRLAAGLLLALDRDADVDGQLAGGREVAGGGRQRQEVALVVGGAARVDAPVADGRLERRRVPEVERLGALDVVVAVDQ
ncbi:MAG TPA: hypothetical protein VFG42_11305, partial [Baekduia sp.]|nr:hypothetical protein [Baekduia sp.]